MLLSQVMAPLPVERLKPSPPWFQCGLDYFGPFQVKDMVRKRITMKVYGVIFTCMTTRAVHLDLAEGYDTPSFLKCFERFVSLRGTPSLLYSDRGTQLVGAAGQVAKQGVTWKFTKGADAPWQNGITESLIRGVKRSLSLAIGESLLPYSDLQTVFFKIANLMNERPIGMKPGSDFSSGTYLCPNDLLLGRPSCAVPSGQFDATLNPSKRMQFVDKMIDSFWTKWTRDYFPSLIVMQKWHTKQRNVREGDIVLVKDSNIVRGHWKMGLVCKTTPGADGQVRNVIVKYKLPNPSKSLKDLKYIQVDRAVHNLVMLLPVEE